MDSSTGSAADKKRNKLGYHRTSVACVHCRRRKIRCLLAANDAQGRCENCIRLKKECHFFPVDQQPAVDKRGRPGTKIDATGAEVALATTPPILGGTQIGEQEESYFQYSAVPMNASQDNSSLTSGHFAGTPMAVLPQDPLVAPHVGAGPPLNQPIPWNDPNYFEQQVTGISSGTPLNSVTDVIIQQEPTLAVSISSASPIVIPQNSAPIVPSNIPTAQVFNTAQEAAAWGIPASGPMNVPSPSGTVPTPQQFAGQLQAPSPVGASGLRGQMTSPAAVYPGALSPLVPGPSPSGSIGASYGTQAPPMAYPTWNNIAGAPPEALSHPGQVVVGTASDSLAIAGWYAPDTLQYSGVPPDETQMMQDQNQGSFVPSPLQRQG